MDMQNSFTVAKSDKFPTECILVYLPMVAQRISNVCTRTLHSASNKSKFSGVRLQGLPVLVSQTPGFIFWSQDSRLQSILIDKIIEMVRVAPYFDLRFS